MVLVVDDDELAHEAYRALLETEPLELVHVYSGAEAFRVLEGTTIDLILCDVLMPDLDGHRVCSTLKAHPRWGLIPVILVTALGEVGDMVRGIEAGADEFLTKPVSGPLLRARVKAVLRLTERWRSAVPAPTLEHVLRGRVDAASDTASLTRREREVLELLLLGRSFDEISLALAITPRTARFHQDNVLRKLGADSRAELLRVLL